MVKSPVRRTLENSHALFAFPAYFFELHGFCDPRRDVLRRFQALESHLTFLRKAPGFAPKTLARLWPEDHLHEILEVFELVQLDKKALSPLAKKVPPPARFGRWLKHLIGELQRQQRHPGKTIVFAKLAQSLDQRSHGILPCHRIKKIRRLCPHRQKRYSDHRDAMLKKWPNTNQTPLISAGDETHLVSAPETQEP